MTKKLQKTSILKYIKDLNDSRFQQNQLHIFTDIVTIIICATACGAKGWVGIETYANGKIDWLKTFLDLPNGVPSASTFRRCFVALDTEQFEKQFKLWVSDSFEKITGRTIALDGKTVKASHQKNKGLKALHIITAYFTDSQISLGQIKTFEKSNEITAIPQLLDLLDISDSVITTDAMGCQKKIVEKVIQGGADYCLALKDNHKRLFTAVKKHFDKELLELVETEQNYNITKDFGHGRDEVRRYYTLSNIQHLPDAVMWKDFKSVTLVISERLVNGVLSTEKRYYISSLEDVSQISKSIRKHWAIENNLHWTLDVTLREDECRKRAGNSGVNFAILRRIILNLLKQEKTFNKSIEQKQFKAAIDNNYLLTVLGVGI